MSRSSHASSFPSTCFRRQRDLVRRLKDENPQTPTNEKRVWVIGAEDRALEGVGWRRKVIEDCQDFESKETALLGSRLDL